VSGQRRHKKRSGLCVLVKIFTCEEKSWTFVVPFDNQSVEPLDENGNSVGAGSSNQDSPFLCDHARKSRCSSPSTCHILLCSPQQSCRTKSSNKEGSLLAHSFGGQSNVGAVEEYELLPLLGTVF